MWSFFESIMSRLQEIFHPETLGEQLAQWFANFIVGIVVFGSFYLLWRVLKMLLQRSLRERFDETALLFVHSIVKYGLLSIGLVYALNAMNIRTTAVHLLINTV